MRKPYTSLDEVLDLMKSQVRQYTGDPQLRDIAVQITKGIPADPRTGLPNRRNFDAIAQAVYTWMKANIAYVRDPHNIEWLQSPDKTLKLGYGDCDDQSILAASLLSSLGVPTRFKVVKSNPNNPDSFSHIYVQYLAGGSWKGFDPTLHTQAGHELADHHIFGVRLVDLSDALTPENPIPVMSALLSTRNRLDSIPAPVYDIRTGNELGALPVAAIGATAASGAKIGAVANGVLRGVSGLFGNRTKSNQARRDDIRQGLYDAGVSRSLFTNYKHSQWGAGIPLLELMPQYGEAVVTYINQTADPNREFTQAYGDSLAAGFMPWYQARQSQFQNQAVNSSSPSSPSVPATATAGLFSGVPAWQLGTAGVLLAGMGYFIIRDMRKK